MMVFYHGRFQKRPQMTQVICQCCHYDP